MMILIDVSPRWFGTKYFVNLYSRITKFNDVRRKTWQFVNFKRPNQLLV